MTDYMLKKGGRNQLGMFTILTGVVVSELAVIAGLYADLKGMIQITALPPQTVSISIMGLGLIICVILVYKAHS
jgi:hypothetical protein